MANTQIFMDVIGILAAVAVFSIIAIVIRIHYQHQTEPSKKHPQGQILAEFRQLVGPPNYIMRPVKPNGWEIEPPPGEEEKLRYFFTPGSIVHVKYPAWMPFDFMRVEVRRISWHQNHAMAIDPILSACPHCDGELVISKNALPADLQNALRDTDVLSMTEEILREDRKREELMFKAMANQTPRQHIYIFFIVCIILSIVGIVAAFLAYSAAKHAAKIVGG